MEKMKAASWQCLAGAALGLSGAMKLKRPPAAVRSRRFCWHLVLHEGSWSRVKRPEHVSCQAFRSSQTLLRLCLATKRLVKR